MVCAYFYYKRYKNDPILLKGVLAFMIAVDIANSALQNVIVYLITITNYGNAAFLAQGTVYYALQVLLPSTTA